jgi:predicted membrane protein
MTPYETVDFYLSSAFLIALLVFIVVCILLGVISAIYYTIKTIYLDYKKSFKKQKRTVKYMDFDWKCAEEKLIKAEKNGWLSDLDFSHLMQDLLISKDGYVIDTGNNECVNSEVALRLADRIKKHPVIWAIFFMVA